MKTSKAEAIEAIKILIQYIGDSLDRDDLKNTPTRVIKAFDEFFCGYKEEDNIKKLYKTFDKTGDYHGMILLKDIRYESFCEHHLAPIIGLAHVAYIPDQKIIGLSKLAKIIDLYAKRLTIQERVVVQASNLLNDIVKPQGVAIFIEANHHCLATRGAHKTDAMMVTEHYTGIFQTDKDQKMYFLKMIK